MEYPIEILLVVMLALTLFHALRLERALGVLRRDRTALEALVSGFDASSRAAEQGIARLREAADGAGRQVARQTELARALKDDLQFLAERGERLADRLEPLVRGGRAPVASPTSQGHARELTRAPVFAGHDEDVGELPARVRSQAERDLLKALRLAR